MNNSDYKVTLQPEKISTKRRKEGRKKNQSHEEGGGKKEG